jgi:VWFA-related protein
MIRRLLLSLLIAVPVFAQHAESIDVRVMEIEAVVVDRDGRLVEGLRAGDFEVTVGGKKRPLSNFYAVRQNRIVSDPGESTSQQPATAIPTSLIIFIDDNRLGQGAKTRAMKALDKYIRANVGELTTAMIVTYRSQLSVRVRPTEKPGYLLAELAKIAKEPASAHIFDSDSSREVLIDKIDRILMAGTGCNSDPCSGKEMDLSPDWVWHEVERVVERETKNVDHTLKALREAVKLASGFSGRKVLLYVSEGLPLMPGSDLLEYWQRMADKSPLFSNFSRNMNYGSKQILRWDRTAQFQALANEAQKANVSFFSFDAGGLRGFEGTDVTNPTRGGTFNTFLATASRDGGAQLVAEQTGGRFIRNGNDIDKVLLAMSEQFSTYYSLGVAADPRARSMDVQVKVKNRPGLRVISARRRTPLTRGEELARNVRSRLYSQQSENPLGATLSVGTPVPIGGRCVATIRIEVPRPVVETVGIHFVLLNEKNDESDIRSASVPVTATPLTHSFTIGLQPQKHVFSLAIDAGGETSYLQKEIDGGGCVAVNVAF